jgi:Zc3h12a-like Ribonuclease NYN domain
MPNDPAPNRQIVVDGSNLATEGRSLPSLAQLEEAIQAFLEEFPGFRNADVIVVVDASFGHRIDESERATFEEAIAHGEMVTPPAGAIGRGDAFILRIAEKAGALVLSNDSFQEFHVERPWLFEPGRLIGGKPIPGVGRSAAEAERTGPGRRRGRVGRLGHRCCLGQRGRSTEEGQEHGQEDGREGKESRGRRRGRRSRQGQCAYQGRGQDGKGDQGCFQGGQGNKGGQGNQDRFQGN